MMKNILLPTDFSENSWNAILYAIKLFENNNCNFYLHHIVKFSSIVADEVAYVPVPGVIEDNYLNPSKEELSNLVKRISAEVGHNKNHTFLTLVDFNFFLDAIRLRVENETIDFIVMGTKGASGLKQYILGSNAAEVITKVKCTTLVVPEEAKFHMLSEVVFPTDYSSFFRIETLKVLMPILKREDSSLRILYINKTRHPLSREQLSRKEILNEFFAEIDHSFHVLTNQKFEDAMECFVVSREIDMIVMVAKNLNYFQQLLFHSKLKHITYHTKIPFLVLHDRA